MSIDRIKKELKVKWGTENWKQDVLDFRAQWRTDDFDTLVECNK